MKFLKKSSLYILLILVGLSSLIGLWLWLPYILLLTIVCIVIISTIKKKYNIDYEEAFNRGFLFTIIIMLITLPPYLITISKLKKSNLTNNNYQQEVIKPITKNAITYTSTKIINQEWMNENLSVSNYQNGDPILEAKTWDEWENYALLKQGCFCRGFSKNYESKYGKLYNWYAVNDSRGIAPKGWHIPDSTEWTTLINNLGTPYEASVKLKSTSGWINDGNGDNSTKFNGKSNGYLNVFSNQYFIGEHSTALWWSKTEINDFNYEAAYHDKEIYCLIIYSNTSNDKDICKLIGNDKGDGLAIRCVKN